MVVQKRRQRSSKTLRNASLSSVNVQRISWPSFLGNNKSAAAFIYNLSLVPLSRLVDIRQGLHRLRDFLVAGARESERSIIIIEYVSFVSGPVV